MEGEFKLLSRGRKSVGGIQIPEPRGPVPAKSGRKPPNHKTCVNRQSKIGNRQFCPVLRYFPCRELRNQKALSEFDGGIKFMSRICTVLFAILLCVGSSLAQGPPKIKVLILTGVSNHQWPATTQVLRQILEQTGRFEVRVNEEVRGNGSETFAPYDVLLLNYTDRQQTEGP
jgi:hypothetical protein